MIIPEGSNKNRYLAVVEIRVLANSKKKILKTLMHANHY